MSGIDDEYWADQQAMMDAARLDKKTVQLIAPPVHHPACDDPDGKFAWWQISDQATGAIVGYFHAPHGRLQ